MAYAQQPRYGATTRPPNQNDQLSYGSSREPYAAKNEYGLGSQAADFNGSSRRVPPQDYQNTNELPGGSYGYNEDWQTQDNSYDGGNRPYGGRGQNRGGRWPPSQRPQGRPTEAGRHLRNDPRSRGPPPGRGRYRQQDAYYQSNQYSGPQGHQQHYQPEGMYHNGSQEHQNDEYGNDEYSLDVPDSWTPVQHYNRPPHSDDQSYQDPEHNASYHQQNRGDSYDRRVSPRSHRNDQAPRQPEAPASRFDYSQPNSTRPHNPQQPRPCKLANV